MAATWGLLLIGLTISTARGGEVAPSQLAKADAKRPQPAGGIAGLEYIDTSFENASPLSYESAADGTIYIHLLYDHQRSSPNRAAGHIHFRLCGRPGSTLTLEFNNLENIYNGKRNPFVKEMKVMVVSQDGRRWTSMPTKSLPENRVQLTVTMPGPSLYVALVEPYRLSDLDKLLTSIRNHPRVGITPIGKTVDGRELEIVRVGDPQTPHHVFLRARAHPWETGGNWVVEGLIRRLLQNDADVEKYLKRYCVWIMPMANKDGVARGRTRFNMRGVDLNRDWDKPADAQIAPENIALEKWLEGMIASGRRPQLALDLHNSFASEIHVSRAPVPGLKRYLEHMANYETLLRKHTWFTEGATKATVRNPGTLGEGWLERYNIDAAIQEFSCTWIAGVKDYPSGRHWKDFGAKLADVFYEYFNAAKPNILLIMTDQQFAEAMSCVIGKQYLNTPAMDSLAAGGMRFTHAYSPNPLCVPARTSIFTGYYPCQTGIQTNDNATIDPKKFPSMGTIFKTAGYDTGFCGKWHMPLPIKDVATHGFTWRAGGDKHDEANATAAVKFLKTKRDKPFLLVVSLTNPHDIAEWSRGQTLPSDGQLTDPPPPDQCPPRRWNFATPRNETDSMLLMRKSYQSAPMFPVGGFDENKWRQYLWAYYRLIEKADALVARVLAALHEAGQDENTVIFFTADHGDCQGAHGWNQKTVFFDEATRVPLIVTLPGKTKAGTSDRLVTTGVDLIPTMCDYAGIPLPKDLPGMSLKPTANGKASAEPRQYVVTSIKMVQGAKIEGAMPVCNGRMVRSPRFKYCVYDIGRRRESFVDMDKDPGELTNLAGDAVYAGILRQHREYLRQWRAKVDDKFDVPR